MSERETEWRLVTNDLTAAVGGATWRHLHGIEAGSDERRGNAWGEGRRWHAYRTRKDWRLERTHTNHWLLHRRNLTTFTGINWISQVRKSYFTEMKVIKLPKIISDQVTHQLAIHNLHINITVTDPHINAKSPCLPVREVQLQQPQVMLASPQAAVAQSGRCG